MSSNKSVGEGIALAVLFFVAAVGVIASCLCLPILLFKFVGILFSIGIPLVIALSILLENPSSKPEAFILPIVAMIFTGVICLVGIAQGEYEVKYELKPVRSNDVARCDGLWIAVKVNSDETIRSERAYVVQSPIENLRVKSSTSYNYYGVMMSSKYEIVSVTDEP